MALRVDPNEPVHAPEMSTALLFCLIVGVTDGDTLTARCGQPGNYEQVKIRVSAIDAPERAQPFGQKSRQALADLCFQQSAKITERDTDRYGRMVADVECQGVDAGESLVRNGLAWVYDRYAQKYQHLYPIQAEAQATKRGLWSESAIAPWDWRRNRR